MPTILEPAGFWSYASIDDEASHGRLSQLKLHLARALQGTVGRRVRIFRDVESIPKGARSEKELWKALDTASFIVPVLTPAFLRSEWCCKEVLRFEERQAASGRDDLMFPLYFTDVDHLGPDDEADLADPAVLPLLRARQWTDFRALRLEDLDHREVRVLLDRLATSIRDALRAPKPALIAGAPEQGPRAPSGKHPNAPAISRGANVVSRPTVTPAVSAPVQSVLIAKRDALHRSTNTGGEDTAYKTQLPLGVSPRILALLKNAPADLQAIKAVLVPPSPITPPWASTAGTDRFGLWADIAVPGTNDQTVTQRLHLIPAGQFMMGSPDDEPGRYDDEGPRHPVTIAEPFWMFDTPAHRRCGRP